MKQKKFNSMSVLLIAVATNIGITIYASCSADDDYDNYSTGNELLTLADGEMNLRSDVGGGTIQESFYGTPIDAGGDTITDVAFYGDIYPKIYTYWTMGFTGNWNPTGPQSYLSVQWGGDCENNQIDSLTYEDGHYYLWYGHITDVDEMVCTWETISRIKYHCHYTIAWYKYEYDNTYVGTYLDGRYITFRREPSFHVNDTIRPISNE